ncbi:hypothetical protein SAMD00019534_101040 [Acytostelium subglobosum LB1]|uniref:hypothetical protein n=1 Tax=Acytostelium subglobosum LB1 TaxID=1410327 RepID=UPI00064510BD|nr:hypothetical protein SAMD00019534_101040 [Acytostelium subglobosum LB1]GAM26929.1 hypothetical protein SAMD00019534_101040 [Acytostelium subglobosum LB1]|eukprot:XP_012750197.1 hypothetical protein SAMD00019534_101040 [Acytostelium subglobosum LB1]
MCLNDKEMPTYILKHGDIDVLQHYLTVTANRMLPRDLLLQLHLAVDSGNEQFVRLLLQHIHIDLNWAWFNANNFNIKFKQLGVRVGMLRLLHEEFNCLFGLRSLWEVALTHSVRCNMVDSVQYILDNLTLNSELYNMLPKCLRRCAKAGNINMFQLICSTPTCKQFLMDNLFDATIDVAVDHTQEQFVNMCINFIMAKEQSQVGPRRFSMPVWCSHLPTVNINIQWTCCIGQHSASHQWPPFATMTL